MQEKRQDFGYVLDRQFDELPTTELQRHNLENLERYGVVEAQQKILNDGLLVRKVQFCFCDNFETALIIENPESDNENITSISIKKGKICVDGVAVEDKTTLSQTIIKSVQQKRNILW